MIFFVDVDSKITYDSKKSKAGFLIQFHKLNKFHLSKSIQTPKKNMINIVK